MPHGEITLDDCWWYHSMDIPGIGSVEGQWDLRGRFADYTGGIDFRGKTVLDVGAASGCLTFESELAGAAEVISFDAESHRQIQHLPGMGKGDTGETFRKMRSGYRLAHQAFKSRAKPVYGNIYQMSEFAPRCDVVIVGQILVHLRDPLPALEQAALLAGEKIIVTEGVYKTAAPAQLFLGGSGNALSWWHISVTLYKQWLSLLGFEMATVTRANFRCNAVDRDVELCTMIAERKSAPQ